MLSSADWTCVLDRFTCFIKRRDTSCFYFRGRGGPRLGSASYPPALHLQTHSRRHWPYWLAPSPSRLHPPPIYPTRSSSTYNSRRAGLPRILLRRIRTLSSWRKLDPMLCGFLTDAPSCNLPFLI